MIMNASNGATTKSSSMSKVLVVVPTYNERDNIEKLINILFSLNLDLEILIMDDGDDGTDRLTRELQRGNSRLHLIKREGKGGRGSAVVQGLKWGLAKDYDYLVEMDADISHDPEELPKLLHKAAPDTVVIGSRYLWGSRIIGWPLRRRAFSKFANIYAELILGLGIHDYTNGFRVYPRGLLERMNFGVVKSRGFIALSEIAYELFRLGAKFAEVPIRFVNRRRGASSFSLKEIQDAFLSVLRIKFGIAEIIALSILAASFFVGLAHGLPQTTVTGDESPNVGGVLRALENSTLLPAGGDVPYATVTYLVSYVFIVGYLVLVSPFFGFDLLLLKNHFLDNPHELYLVTRIASALLAVAAAVILHKVARRGGLPSWQRISVAFLVMTNIIVAAMFHTTKIWALSTVLALLSVYYLYIAVKEHSSRAVFWSIFWACLGLANFPLNLYSVGAALLVVLVVFRKEEKLFSLIIKPLGAGLAVFAAITLLNWQNVLDQAATILAQPAGQGIEISKIVGNFLPYAKKVFLLFPLLLVPLLAAKGIRDRILFKISLLFVAVYFILISITSNWVSENNSLYRHLMPMGFFLGLLLTSLRLRRNWILPLAAGISLVYYGFTLAYFSLPTTYNRAYDWTWTNLNNESAVIVNQVSHLQLPLNAKSAALLEERFCSTRCREAGARNLNADFRPLVFDARRGKPELYPRGDFYLFTTTPRPAENLVAMFGSASGQNYFTVDNRLGTYFDLDYFKIKNLGEQIYVYRLR